MLTKDALQKAYLQSSRKYNGLTAAGKVKLWSALLNLVCALVAAVTGSLFNNTALKYAAFGLSLIAMGLPFWALKHDLKKDRRMLSSSSTRGSQHVHTALGTAVNIQRVNVNTLRHRLRTQPAQLGQSLPRPPPTLALIRPPSTPTLQVRKPALVGISLNTNALKYVVVGLMFIALCTLFWADRNEDGLVIFSSLTHDRQMMRTLPLPPTKPLEVHKSETVGSGKTMSTHATLYRDGTIFCEIYTDCDNPTHGLRGRALLLVLDRDERVLATFQIAATTRGGLLDFFTPSSGQETRTYSVTQEVAARAARLEVWQADEAQFGNVVKQVEKLTRAAAALGAVI